MPSVQMVPGSTVDVSATTTGPTSATGALASFLVAAILRAKKMTFKPTMTREHTAADLTWSGSRIPVNELDKLPISAEATQHQNTRSRILSIRSKTRRPTDVRSLSDDNSIPQRLTDSTVPIVHDRLPDPKLWEKLNFGTEVEVDDDTLTDLSPQTEEDSSYSLPESSSTHKITKRSISAGLEGIMRRRQLYCRNGYHLQILPRGQVMGTRKDHSRYAILEFVSVNVGVVTIRGVETGLYLAMDSKGRLYGSEKLSRNCLFKETFEENKYNTYSSLRHRNHSDTRSCFVAISQQGRARSGCRSKESQKFTHFLPRLVDPRRVPWHYEGEMY